MTSDQPRGDRGIEAGVDVVLADQDELCFGSASSRWMFTAGSPSEMVISSSLEPSWRRLGVSPRRALHIGDGLVDEEGAAAAGMKFAWAPVPQALEQWA